MGKLNACQIAQLSATPVTANLERYVELINQNIRPPVPVIVSDVFIRAMYIISDAVNTYGGKFDRADLPAIARLFIDSPVLIGHDRSGLPIARNFWAETVERGDHLWIKSYFYWLKAADASAKLAVNIDNGIYKECSVSFVYSHPECTACGGDIRNCGHQISSDVHFIYRGVEKILETSLVYRGSIPETALTDQLSIPREGPAEDCLTSKDCLIISSAFAAGNPLPVSSNLFRARINGIDFILLQKAKCHA